MTPSLSDAELVQRLLTAALLGGVLGFEREIRQKSAGLRTNILIAIGSALFTLMSYELAGEVPGADPGRVAAQIVTGHRLPRRRRDHAHRQRRPGPDHRGDGVGERRGRRGGRWRRVPPRVHRHRRHPRRAARAQPSSAIDSRWRRRTAPAAPGQDRPTERGEPSAAALSPRPAARDVPRPIHAAVMKRGGRGDRLAKTSFEDRLHLRKESLEVLVVVDLAARDGGLVGVEDGLDERKARRSACRR